MACFLVTHQITPDFSPREFLALEKRVLGHLPREIKWVMSWHVPQQHALVAHWDAPTEQAVRVALERSGVCNALPLVKIESAIELYPRRYANRRAAARRHLTRAHAHRPPASARKRDAHPPRELSGAYGEALTSVLQTRVGAAHRR